MKIIIVCCLMVLALGYLTSAQALTKGEYTIVALGDSTTAERFVDGRWMQVYCDLLRNELPQYGITGSVINKGVPSNTSTDAMARFQSDVLDLNPDLVIIQLGINDSAYDVWKEPPATEPRVSLNTTKANLTSMVQQLKSAGSDVILMTPNVLRWTPLMLEYYGQPPYDPNDPWGYNVVLTDYAQAVREVAALQNVLLIDVYSACIEYDQAAGQSVDDLLLDGVHPNEAGHRMVADMLEAQIVPEPATLSFLGTAGVLAGWRKRR